MIKNIESYVCDCCGKVMNPVSEGLQDILTMKNGQHWCKDCYNEHGISCYGCYDLIHIDDIFTFEGEDYCKDCINIVATNLLKQVKEITTFLHQFDN
jgi:hypothetical protein